MVSGQETKAIVFVTIVAKTWKNKCRYKGNF